MPNNEKRPVHKLSGAVQVLSIVLYDPEGYRVAILEVSEMVTKGNGAPRSALMLLDKNEKLIWLVQGRELRL